MSYLIEGCQDSIKEIIHEEAEKFDENGLIQNVCKCLQISKESVKVSEEIQENQSCNEENADEMLQNTENSNETPKFQDVKEDIERMTINTQKDIVDIHNSDNLSGEFPVGCVTEKFQKYDRSNRRILIMKSLKKKETLKKT